MQKREGFYFSFHVKATGNLNKVNILIIRRLSTNTSATNFRFTVLSS